MAATTQTPRTFYVAAGGLTLPSLTALHPMSKAVINDKLDAGKFLDSYTGDVLDEVTLQLLGSHPSRMFYKPDPDADYDEFRALVEVAPEVKGFSGSTLCASENGHQSTSGIWMGQVCAECPHQGRCSERTLAMVHITGEGPSATAREMPINWASQGAFTRMLLDGKLRGVPPWHRVHTLGTTQKPGKRGVSIVLTILESRDATEEEIADADAVVDGMVGPILDIIMGQTPVAPMLVVGDAPRAVRPLPLAPSPQAGRGDEGEPPAGTPVPLEEESPAEADGARSQSVAPDERARQADAPTETETSEPVEASVRGRDAAPTRDETRPRPRPRPQPRVTAAGGRG